MPKLTKQQINEIVKPYSDRLAKSNMTTEALKILAIDAYQAGMERARKEFEKII